MEDKYEYTLVYQDNDRVLTSRFRADKTFEELLELLINFLTGCSWDKEMIDKCLIEYCNNLKTSKEETENG